MKLIQILIGIIMALPLVSAQTSNTEAVFFLAIFDTIIFLVIGVFIFLASKKLLGNIK